MHHWSKHFQDLTYYLTVSGFVADNIIITEKYFTTTTTIIIIIIIITTTITPSHLDGFLLQPEPD